MTFPEWTKPGLYGAALGAVAISIIGFNWGGWVTGGSAEKMAKEQAEQAVTLSMVPVCLERAATDPERLAKLATIRAATSYNRRNAIMDTGWATLPGEDNPSRDLAEACKDGLNLGA